MAARPYMTDFMDDDTDNSQPPLKRRGPYNNLTGSNSDNPLEAAPMPTDVEPATTNASPVFACQTHAVRIKAALTLLTSSREHFFAPDDLSNFVFLRETLDLTLKYLDMQSSEVKEQHTFQLLVQALSQSFEATHAKLLRLLRKETVVTDTFEMYELVLRYLEQFRKMFPVGKASPRPACVLIEDTQARAFWEAAFGAETEFVSFERFDKKLIEPQFGAQAASRNFQAALRYMVNFPADDMVTTYKWNLLTRLFGPYDQFMENFCKIALGKGFLGLINRVKAREILTVHGDKTLLIRFSRTAPEFLAITYRDGPDVGNVLNVDRHGNLVPLETFLRVKFPSYTPVATRLDVQAIVSSGSLGHYTDRSTSGYLHQN